jgi:transposase InsO family protein
VSPVHSIETYLLDRQFEATGPNQKWAADFTYVWTGKGWLFVAVVLDLYSRRVVGWSMQTTMTAQLVMDALLMASFAVAGLVKRCDGKLLLDALDRPPEQKALPDQG